MAHVVVNDDTFLLHRDESVELYTGITDDQIAQAILLRVKEIVKAETDTVPPSNDLTNTTTVLRGTPMKLLQDLVRRQHETWHVFVRPGAQPGSNVGFFKKDPAGDSGLPTMVLLGKNRNVLNLRLSSTAVTPAVFRGSAISLSSANEDSGTASLSEIDRLGTNPPAGTPVKRMLRPGQSRNVNLQNAVKSASEQVAFALTADGEVLKDTYPVVLQPYQNVQVIGANGKLSGLWLIRQVTHTLTRNSYGQTFSMQRNALSSGTGSSNTAALPVIC
jgi:hypothetical protein